MIDSQMLKHSLYFAYGSNMFTKRLRDRMPSCRPVGIAKLLGYTLKFHKRSVDRSGKCNAFPSMEDDFVMGVLFSFDPAERLQLDKAEGVGNGYKHAAVTVVHGSSRPTALTYLAASDYIDDDLSPYSWYKALVSAGAMENGLPREYIARYIELVPTIEDPNLRRDKEQRLLLSEQR